MNPRPDITFNVTKLAKFIRLSGRLHFKALSHLLGYLHDNAQYGLKYYWKIEGVHEILRKINITDKHNMFGMCNSSWQDCVDKGRSTGSIMIFYQGGLCTSTFGYVDCRSRVQRKGVSGYDNQSYKNAN